MINSDLSEPGYTPHPAPSPLPTASYQGHSYQTGPPIPSQRPHKSRPRPPARPEPSSSQAYQEPEYDDIPEVEDFQLSRCTGKKRALCIGINYTGQPNQLEGCVNDARNVMSYLIQRRNWPTKAKILSSMKWLVKDAQADDSLFLHYSGHGGQTRDLDGDETDGMDELIFPMDYKKNGIILDDEMHRIMVKPLRPGVRLTALFDVRSYLLFGLWIQGFTDSVIFPFFKSDLPYLYHSNGRVKGSQVSAKHFMKKSTKADVISFSGCNDSQTSADTIEGGLAVGAMSHAFISVLKSNPNQSYQQLLRSVRDILRKRYSQKPQLSSSHRIDTTLKFII
ncbi:hypothetical protein NLI96_g7333 [Meripilus lineatus]|uniref:Peptidase C14 caspase domain-containing protein n=1 Tax=Meripilus lineatus TaxID=2056292 RepID=A0AAD5V462_9APHY|nr:hypothetical protein NLI96_g7333 [Physisporinus lineatus]